MLMARLPAFNDSPNRPTVDTLWTIGHPFRPSGHPPRSNRLRPGQGAAVRVAPDVTRIEVEVAGGPNPPVQGLVAGRRGAIVSPVDLRRDAARPRVLIIDDAEDNRDIY